MVNGPWRSYADNWFGETFFQLGRILLALLVYFAPGRYLYGPSHDKSDSYTHLKVQT